MYIIYSKEDCVNCERAKALLLSKGIKFEEVNVYESEHMIAVLRSRGVRQLPYITKEDRVVGGLEELKKELF